MDVTSIPSPIDQPIDPDHDASSSGMGPADPIDSSNVDSPNIEKPYVASPSPKPFIDPEKGLISRLKEAREGSHDHDGGSMSFMDHLMELRKRLWVSLLAILICMGLALYHNEAIFELLKAPVDAINQSFKDDPVGKQALIDWERKDVIQLQTTNPLSIMMTVVWIGIGAGLVLSSPIIMYELWSFVAPGLKPNEKRAIRPVLFFGIFFFLGGCYLAYKALVPVSMNFLAMLAVKLRIRPDYTIDDYMSLLLNMMFITGLICEMPLVVAVLARLSLVKPTSLTAYWRPAILGTFVLGAVLSPGTDIIAMLLFSALLFGLYLVSILFAYIFYPKEVKT